jgi:hypothetical protein
VSRRLVLFACALGVSFAITPGVLASLARPHKDVSLLYLDGASPPIFEPLKEQILYSLDQDGTAPNRHEVDDIAHKMIVYRQISKQIPFPMCVEVVLKSSLPV